MTYVYSPLITFLGGISFLMAVWILMVLSVEVFKRKSFEYRKEITDMYVVGKIKQLADKEGINLMKEFSEFTKVTKQKKINFQELDKTIEQEIQEKISKGNAKVLESQK